jgi:hypothetical protein
VAGWWFSPVSSTNKTDHHNITEILLKGNLKSLSDILMKLKTEFNAIGSGNWE